MNGRSMQLRNASNNRVTRVGFAPLEMPRCHRDDDPRTGRDIQPQTFGVVVNGVKVNVSGQMVNGIFRLRTTFILCMINMTSLEYSVIFKMIVNEVRDPDRAHSLVRNMRLKGRTFSPDALDVERCAGFYLDFYECKLPEIEAEKSHFATISSHPTLSVGGHFMLFRHSSRGPYLEGSFYGESIPMNQLLSSDHGFILEPAEGLP
jgi:hypothetical protein